MRSLWPLALSLVAAPPLAAQFGTAAMTPPPDPPRRGAAISPPKVQRRYSKSRDLSGVFVSAGPWIGFNGDAYTISCGYGYPGKVPPSRLDSLFITITYSEPYGSKPEDPTPSLTIDADTIHVVVRQVVSTSFGTFFEYQDQLHYRLPLGLFRAVFDVDSADFRVRRRVYHMRGRAVEVCRWFGDRVADGSLPP